MKRNSLFVMIFSYFLIINSCKPEFIGYDCESRDNKSILQIDNDYYSFFEEKITKTEINENDTTILINYSITHYPIQTGNGNADNTIKDAISLEIYLIKNSLNKITLDSIKSNVKFYELNNQGQIFAFSEFNLIINDYQTCDCSNELKIPLKTPNLFNAVITGKIKHNNVVKNINFQINFETTKVKVYAK